MLKTPVTHTDLPNKMEPEFKTTHPVKAVLKKSSLFFFIQTLLVQDRVLLSSKIANVDEIILLQKDKTEVKPTREAYLIPLKKEGYMSRLSWPGYSNFVFEDRHLSVDKYYSTREQDKTISIAHYTEKYKNPENDEVIITHVYYDAQAKIVNVQAKKTRYIKVDNIDVTTMIEIEPVAKNMIYENAMAAFDVLIWLLLEKGKQHQKSIEKSKELEKELEEAVLALNKEKVKKISLEYKKSIAEINKWCDIEFDFRGQFSFKKIIENFASETKSKEEITPNNNEETEENLSRMSTVLEAVEIKSIKKNRKIKPVKIVSQKDFNTILEALEGVERNLRNAPQKISDIAKVEIAIDLHNAVIAYKNTLVDFLMIEGVNTKKDHSIEKISLKIHAIEKMIKKLPDLLELLKKYLMLGEFQNFKELFLALNPTDHSFYSFIPSFILKAADDTKNTTQYIKILEFLYDNSELYKMYILCNSSRMFPVKIDDQDARLITPLGHAVFSDNFEIFNILLQQGYNHSVHLVAEEKPYSLLNIIIALESNPQFMETALQYGAVIDYKEPVSFGLSNQAFESFKPTKKELKNMKKLATKNVAGDIFNNSIIGKLDKKGNSDIAYAARRDNFSVLPLLALRSDLLETCIAITGLLLDTRGLDVVMCAPSKEPGIFVCQDSNNEFVTVGSQLENHGMNNCIAHLIRSKILATEDIKKLVEVFKSRIVILNDKERFELLTSLRNRADSMKADDFHKAYCFQAGIYILSFTEKLTLQDKINLITFNILKLNCYSRIRHASKEAIEESKQGEYANILRIIYMDLSKNYFINDQYYGRIMEKAWNAIKGTVYEYLVNKRVSIIEKSEKDVASSGSMLFLWEKDVVQTESNLLSQPSSDESKFSTEHANKK